MSGFPMILGLSSCILGFYHRDGFILGSLYPEKHLKYAHTHAKGIHVYCKSSNGLPITSFLS